MHAVAGYLLLLGALVLFAVAVLGTVLIIVARRRKARRIVFLAKPEIPAPYIPSFDERFPPKLAPPEAAPRFCGQCGVPLGEGFSFCPKCGSPTK